MGEWVKVAHCWKCHPNHLTPCQVLFAPSKYHSLFQKLGMEWWTGQVKVLLSYTFCGRWERHKISELVGHSLAFSGGSVVKKKKKYACKAGNSGSTPGSGRSPGEGNGNLLQYFCLGNSMDRGAWRATVHGVAKESERTWWLNNSSKGIPW